MQAGRLAQSKPSPSLKQPFSIPMPYPRTFTRLFGSTDRLVWISSREACLGSCFRRLMRGIRSMCRLRDSPRLLASPSTRGTVASASFRLYRQGNDSRVRPLASRTPLFALQKCRSYLSYLAKSGACVRGKTCNGSRGLEQRQAGPCPIAARI